MDEFIDCLLDCRLKMEELWTLTSEKGPSGLAEPLSPFGAYIVKSWPAFAPGFVRTLRVCLSSRFCRLRDSAMLSL